RVPRNRRLASRRYHRRNDQLVAKEHDMGFLDASKIDAAKVVFDARFNAALANLAAGDSFVKLLASVFPMSGPTLQFNWLGFPGGVKQWIGNRQLERLRNFNYQLVSKDWESSLQIDQNDLEDDNLGLYQPRIDMLAQAFIQHQEELFISLLTSGFATTSYGAGYDGVAFFSASHTDGEHSNQSNTATATLDDTSVLDTGIAAMMALQRDDNKPLGIKPSHLLVGPSNRATANALVKAERLANGASNTNYNVVELHVSPYITDGKWFLLDLSKPLKPLFYGERKAIWTDAVVEGTGPFMNRQLLFGAAARYNAVYGLWQLAYGSNATT
ncbi:MAG: Mu-like prophage major head subunit gpT family protein, partial [Pseudomonadota bacterium]